jgi:hypothetical protein
MSGRHSIAATLLIVATFHHLSSLTRARFHERLVSLDPKLFLSTAKIQSRHKWKAEKFLALMAPKQNSFGL